MTVAARALIAGPAGDIAAGDIYGPCSRLNVSAVNSAFHGGQNARSYPTVTPQDISTIAASMNKTVMQSVQAALQTQVSSAETLITPLPCQQRVTSNHQPGTEAAQATITISEICTGTVYDTQQYHLIQSLNQQAQRQLGQGYSAVTATSQHQNIVMLHVTSAATYTYQMSGQQQKALFGLIAGKTNAQATSLLLYQPGIQSVALETTVTGHRLPSDPDRLHFIIVGAV